DGQQEGMAEGFDVLERAQLLLGGAGAIQYARGADELDGLFQAAGCLALPHLAEAAPTEGLEEAVAGDGFLIDRVPEVHRCSRHAPDRATTPGRHNGGSPG